MPVTVAHPAAILPLRRLGLPTAALAAGAMAPDVPLLTGGRSRTRRRTRSPVCSCWRP
ncbi:DUF4184 family protein [Nocardioidaceae bacterium]|nr:DUF4184 family protein [Nocardioidaceae bacterium]